MALAMLGMTGRVTMLGLSRWAGPGGSERTVPRFCATAIPWATLLWGCLRHQGSRSEEVSRLVGDAGVVPKAGTTTHGLDRFCASLEGKPVPGVAFFALSLVSVQARRSLPLRVEHVVRSAEDNAISKAKAAATKPKAPGAPRRPGRPKGSQNKAKTDRPFTPEFWRLPGGRDALLTRIAGGVALPSVVLDGPFGHHNALPRARQSHLHLIATRRREAALDVPDTGPDAGRGPGARMALRAPTRPCRRSPS